MEIVVIFILIVLTIILIGVLTYVTQCQIQKLVEDVTDLRYDIQEIRKRLRKNKRT